MNEDRLKILNEFKIFLNRLGMGKGRIKIINSHYSKIYKVYNKIGRSFIIFKLILDLREDYHQCSFNIIGRSKASFNSLNNFGKKEIIRVKIILRKNGIKR